MSRLSLRDRTESLLVTARTNPEFARRLAQDLSDEARAAFVSELSKPERPAPARAARPGLAKCAPSPYASERGFAAQIRVVAQRAARVR